MPKKPIKVEGEIDLTKIKRGHTPHKSGVGPHKVRRRKSRKKVKEEIQKGNYNAC